MSRRRTLAIGGVALALMGGIGGIAWRSLPAPSVGPVPGAANRTAGGRLAAPAVPTPARPAAPAAGEALPPSTLPGSLEGTEPDGAVEADASGHLIITIELRRLFDHFLAASGEESVATMRARIIAVLHARLPDVAAAEAIAILDRYLAYRDAARRLVPPSSDPVVGLDQVHDLRSKMFSPDVVKAFFADEEAATYAALARRDVLADTTLSAAERERRLTEIDAHTPPAVLAARAAAIAPVNELNRETQLRAAGASDQEIAAARTAALGADAAARLADLDRAHAAWDARLAQFRAARAAMLADPALGDAERQRRIDDLLARTFTESERLRVEVLDRIASGSGRH